MKTEQKTLTYETFSEIKENMIKQLQTFQDMCREQSDLDISCYATNLENAILHMQGEISAP